MNNVINNNYDTFQKMEIEKGLEAGIDVTVYAKPEFDSWQMKEIRIGLEAGIDVTVYAKPEFDSWQMKEIRLGLEEGLDVTVYADPSIDHWYMKKARNRMFLGIPVISMTELEELCNESNDIADTETKETNIVRNVSFGNLVMKGDGFPCLEVKIEGFEHSYYLSPFRGYKFQVSGTVDGFGDYGSTDAFGLGNIVNMRRDSGTGYQSNLGSNTDKYVLAMAAYFALALFAEYPHCRDRDEEEKTTIVVNPKLCHYGTFRYKKLKEQGKIFDRFIDLSYDWVKEITGFSRELA